MVIGSGLAGILAAIKLSKIGTVAILTKKKLSDCSTNLAQGGIAAVFRKNKNDSVKNHFQDTICAGGGICNPDAVKFLVENGETAIHFLQNLGIKFNTDLHKEGGHSSKRVWHISDQTGKFLHQQIVKIAKKNSKISFLENCQVFKLIFNNNKIFGAHFWNQKNKKTDFILAQKTILATGGIGNIFEKTTNPKTITGDGIALAAEFGAKISQTHFIQFHPTAFDSNTSPQFLLSEALRGEGAKICDQNKNFFINYLLPRDIVARAVFQKKYLNKKKEEKVFLDFSAQQKKFWQKHFPNIFEKLAKNNFSIPKDLVPICPVAHFCCGGIETDLFGRTNLKNLFAIGEVANTGLHGANRLASNSLLECVVFAISLAKFLKNQHSQKQKFPKIKPEKFIPNNKSDLVLIKKIQKKMQITAGIIRNQKKMKKTWSEFKSFSPHGTTTKIFLQTANIILSSAIDDKKSCGCHFLENN